MTMNPLPDNHQTALPTIYKRGTKGEVRIWRKEIGSVPFEDIYGTRTLSGTLNGKQAVSGWSVAEPKNVGKANETTSKEQAIAEAKADFDKKLRTGYFQDSSMIDQVPFTKPMLATAWEKRKDKIISGTVVYVQPKLDGIRCIARVDGLWTRTGKKITACPHIKKALEPFFEACPHRVLDGELYNHELRDDFNQITSIVRKQNLTVEDVVKSARYIQYHVYDTVEGRPLQDRLLEVLLAESVSSGDVVRAVNTVVVHSDGAHIDEVYSKWIEEGYEGQMIRLDTPYENKRSNSLMKRKDFITEEFPVISVSEGNGNWAGCVKDFEVRLPDGRENGAGVRGTQAVLEALIDKPTPDWATVRYFGLTPAGKLRFPVVVDWGWGKRED